MDKNKIKFVVAIQCEHSRTRCSGFACANSFFERNCSFAGYPEDTKFITMTCGGCNGTGVAGQLEHFAKKMHAMTDVKKSEVAVHFASCAVTENRHHDRCPYIENMKDIVERHGFADVIEGTFESPATKKLREMGKYKTYESVCFE